MTPEQLAAELVRHGIAPATASKPEIRWDPRFERPFRRQGFRGFVSLGDAVADRQAMLRKHADTLGSTGVYAVFTVAIGERFLRLTGQLPFANVHL
jgi:hypothetical protein